jgi:membrane fusion protein, hemolysin D
VSARVLRFFPRPTSDRGAAERAFLPAALEIVETPASPTIRYTLVLICLFLTSALAWACIGHVDIIATAPGKIIVDSRTKVVQPEELGVVSMIAVADGQHVQAGQVLVELDPASALADLNRAQEALTQAQLDRARLHAELDPRPGDPFATVLAPPDLLASARARLTAERSDQAAKVAKVDQQMAENRAEQADIAAQIAKIDAALPMIRARSKIRMEGVQTGFGNMIDMLNQEQELVEQEHERLVLGRKTEASRAAYAELVAERAQVVASFRQQAFADLAKADDTAEAARNEVNRAADRLRHRTLRAPVSGTVQDLSVHTIGGVVTPAQQILRIVPSGGAIEVDVVIGNSDVGFVHLGQAAQIKVAAFPFTRYGLVHGKVIEIARDSVVGGGNNPQPRNDSETASDLPASIAEPERLVYTARIALARTYIAVDGRHVALEPGMAVTAEIKTGRRRVIDFLLSPFQRYASDALTER